MRVAILSTDTPHHWHLINGLAFDFDVVQIILEIQSCSGVPWYSEQRDYEASFFAGHYAYNPIRPGTVIKTQHINAPSNETLLNSLYADIGVVFGTGKLQPHIFNAPKWGCINVHRGISQHYRGLDSELWAIYRRDFENVGVTIHYIDENLDTGDILAQERVICGKHTELYQLRAVQTITALHLVRQVLKRFEEAGGPIEGRPQEKGQYYGAMSLADKFHTLERFNEHREGIA